MANDTWTAPSGPSAGVASLSEMQQQRTDDLYVVELVMEGDQSTSGKVHRHKSGTYASRPAAGNAGRRYYATDMCCEFLDDGSQWLILPPPLQVCDYFYDEFIFDTSALWTESIDDGSGSIAPRDDDDSSVRLYAGTVANQRTRLISRSATTEGFFAVVAARIPAILEFKARQNISGSGHKLIGLHRGAAAAGGDPAGGIYWRYRAGTNVWETVTRSSDTETANSTVSNDTSDHIFRIDILATNSVKFYLDGVLQFTHTTNITTSNLLLVFQCENSGVTGHTMDADYVQMVSPRA